MYDKKTIQDVGLEGKRVFIRVDFNVPLDAARKVADDTRIRASLKTIKHAVDHKARVILASHLGRPKGQDPDKSLKPVAEHLSQLLDRPVIMAPDSIGAEVSSLVSNLKEGEVCLLENVRFHDGEKKNDPQIAKAYASLADIFVNDAFGSCHRAHASTEGVASLVDPAVAGFLLGEEISALGKLLAEPERPFIAILGGKKVSDKTPVIENLLTIVDALVIGGAMAYTFLAFKEQQVGSSVVQEDLFPVVGNLLDKAAKGGVEILLPEESVIGREISDEAQTRIVDSGSIPEGWMGLDIGPKAVEAFSASIKSARTIFWNGPMGVFEHKPFARGTEAIARAVAGSNSYSVIGGGDSVSAVRKAGVADRIGHISTGGGASLAFLAGSALPGIAALTDR
ncbi:phosphoglycerate kinase [Acidobacteriota bacterium]